jgi:hypothetical protein
MAMTWRGPIAPLDRKDGAGRQIPIRNVDTDVRPLPLPFRYQQADWGAHTGAVRIGNMEKVWIETSPSRMLWASGRFNERNEMARDAFAEVEEGFARSLSVDLDPGTGKLMGVTLVHCPAFEEAQISEVFRTEDEEGVQVDHMKPVAFSVVTAADEHIEWSLGLPSFEAEVFSAYTEGAAAYHQYLTGSVPSTEAFNWVDDVGGLPSYIKRISKHLQRKGMSESHAIASAVNAAKKMCSSGDLNWPGLQNVNPGSRAEACAAVASWEANKARAKAS